MGFGRYVHIAINGILKETDKAFLVACKGEEFWVPKSQVADADQYEEGDADITLSITEWFAEKEGIEGD